jgi:sigma-B regulation protein RsbU (phosphoserine phosphatase)
MTYASAGHDAVVLCHPHETPFVLPPTAPLIGVFDDQHHLFRQAVVDVVPGSLLVATTDGLTEARNPAGEFYGTGRLMEAVGRLAHLPVEAVVAGLLGEVETFAARAIRDDIALLAARITT